MKRQLVALILPALSACATSGDNGHADIDLAGMNSFALAARYGTPASYQHLGEYLQLNYGSTAAGCQVIVLVDQAQRVAGWSSSGNHCAKAGIGLKDVLE
ncbi:hypothetical protein [Janthinobacterium sp. LB2P70]|uniref:hypothetical protein n=1 Tax=Janthinobacterium sp. LB2P70 TaxID=3424197 RepID=UPI003F2190AF